MAVYAIICEYNPFHNGHKFQIDSLKPDTVVCLMSSNFVQRGSVAVCDKYLRARVAVECGADLVLELPFPYSMMSAEYFAGAGVSILNRLGFVDCLSFGCEDDDCDALRRIAEYLTGEEYENSVKDILFGNKALPYASAREEAVRGALGAEYAEILKKPNNILAVEYMKALIKSKSSVVPKPLRRRFVEHNDLTTDGNFASAGALRAMLEKGESIKDFVPSRAYELYEEFLHEKKMPSDIKKLETGILAFLRMIPTEKLKTYYDCRAVAEIIKSAAAKAVTTDELYEICSTKSFTRARIRRGVLSAYLGVEEGVTSTLPQYTSVLAFNEKGAELLSKVRHNGEIAVITKPSHIRKYENSEIYRAYMNEVTAEGVFALTLPLAEEAGECMRKTPFAAKK